MFIAHTEAKSASLALPLLQVPLPPPGLYALHPALQPGLALLLPVCPHLLVLQLLLQAANLVREKGAGKARGTERH